LYARLNCHWATLRSWVKDDWKLIVGAESELYNLADDPGETKNLAAEESDRVKRMSDELQRAVRGLARGGADSARSTPITAEQEQRLRSLGYVAGSAGSGPLDDPRLPNPRTHIELYDRLQAAVVATGPELPRAFEAVTAITRLDPENPFAFGTLASMAYRFGNLPDAAQAFARTLELDPDRPGVRQNYGKLLRELGRYTESERELRIAVEQTTADDARTRINLIETLVADGKIAEAETLLTAILAKEPKNAEALGAKAHLLTAQGRVAEALPFFEAATATSDPEPVIELAQAYLAAGDVAHARAAALRAVQMRPGHPWAMAVLGTVLVREGQRAAGLDYLQKAMAAGPRRPAVWMSLARGFETAGQPAVAATCRRNAAALTAASLS
jgi:predicted Zn-dependent protease